MRRPRVLQAIIYHHGADGIVVNISHQLEKVGIGIDQDRLVSSLEQVPGPLLLFVDVSRIAEAEVLDDLGQWDFRHLDDQMNMVGHKTEGMDSMVKPLNTFLKKKREPRIVCR